MARMAGQFVASSEKVGANLGVGLADQVAEAAVFIRSRQASES